MRCRLFMALLSVVAYVGVVAALDGGSAYGAAAVSATGSATCSAAYSFKFAPAQNESTSNSTLKITGTFFNCALSGSNVGGTVSGKMSMTLQSSGGICNSNFGFVPGTITWKDGRTRIAKSGIELTASQEASSSPVTFDVSYTVTGSFPMSSSPAVWHVSSPSAAVINGDCTKTTGGFKSWQLVSSSEPF
jgi:hypothetical protein